MHRIFSAGCVTALMIAAWTVPALAGPPGPATQDDIAELIASAGDADTEAYDDADVVCVLDEADVHVQDSGLATTTSCQIFKILTDQGIKTHSVYREEYDPDTNRVAIDSIRIHRESGAIEDVPISSMITQPTKQWMIYWGGKQHLVSLPRLKIGDCVEIRTSRIGFNIAYLDEGAGASGLSGEGLTPPMPGHWYELTRFQADYPIIKKRYSVHMPKDKPIQYEVYNGSLKTSLWFDKDHYVYTFSAENIPAIEREPRMASLDDCVTKVVMATVPDWEMKSRWFHQVNESQFEADDAIVAKVEEITKDLEDEDAKIAACLHWVSDNIRYYGTSRGPCEGFTLHKGTETFRDKGGVCKDIAGMLITMLRVLDLEVYPALTMAGPQVEPIPADQFNHTVTVVRNKDGSFRILDPTWSPLSRELWSSREALQGLVYGTPEGQTLTRSPYYPPEHNAVVAQSRGSISQDGTLSTTITMDLKGYPCTYLRRNVHKHRASQRQAAFEHVLNVAPNVRLEELEYSDPYDYSRDSYAKMKVSAEHYTAGAQNMCVFRLPLMSRPLDDWLTPDFSYSFSADDREHGMRMRATRLVRYEETLRLPPGWTVEHLPESKKLDSGSASLSFSAESVDGVLTYSFEMAIKNHVIPAEDYPGVKEVIEAMQELADAVIVCRTVDKT